MIATRQPTKPRTGLRVLYKVTQGSAVWIYRCRRCGRTFQWDAKFGPFRQLPAKQQRVIRDHATAHGDS